MCRADPTAVGDQRGNRLFESQPLMANPTVTIRSRRPPVALASAKGLVQCYNVIPFHTSDQAWRATHTCKQ
jgi:hypothetical protein